ncbi:MAG: hypothetical protein JWQ96_2638 [Segetibacter sp.]|nr:hypothetical protein [Segetibacter sp.]
MDKYKLTDLKRIFLGDVPPEFMIEVAIRTFIIYLFLLIIVRLLGNRMTGQLTIVELAIMVTLGAIVAPAAQLPDRGIFYGIVALCAALVFHRSVNRWAVRNEKIEHLTQGRMSTLVKDGVLQLDEMEKAGISHQQLYAQLRSQQVFNLGNVERVYMEACGIFSVFLSKENKVGLPLLPPQDERVTETQMKIEGRSAVCVHCGSVEIISTKVDKCPSCKQVGWSEPYMLKQVS